MFFSRILSNAFELEGFWNKKSKLPTPPMLMIDRISNISKTGGKYGAGFIEAEMDIDPEH